jgi:hypothetical protein
MCGWDRAKGRNIQAVETLGKSVVRPSEVRQADLYSLANAFHLPSLSYAIETTNQESCSTSYSGVAVPVPPGGLPWSQLGSRLNTLAGRLRLYLHYHSNHQAWLL